MGQSKDCTAASRMRFMHAPARRLDQRIYPLCSSDSGQSRGKTLVFPWLKQFFAFPLCCLMNSCKMKKFLLILLSKIFQKLWMFLLFLCLGTILVPSCPASCQPSSSPPPSSGSIMAESSHLSSRSMTAPTPLCAMDPAPSPSESGPGRGHRHQPPKGLHGCGRWAWQPASPQQTAGFAPRRPCRNQAGLIFRPAGIFIFFSGTATRWSWNYFPTWLGSFCTPGTSGASTDAVPVPSTGTATEVRPLTSSPSSQGQSSGEPCGELPTSLVDWQTSWVYPYQPCTVPVYKLLCNC